MSCRIKEPLFSSESHHWPMVGHWASLSLVLCSASPNRREQFLFSCLEGPLHRVWHTGNHQSVAATLFHLVYEGVRKLFFISFCIFPWYFNQVLFENIELYGNSLAVQWLGLCAFTAEGVGSIPGRGTRILQAVPGGQKKKYWALPKVPTWSKKR